MQLGSIGLGAANLGNLHAAMSDDDAWRIVDTAWEAGIRYFDTAPHYGLGLSERRLGAYLRTKPRAEYVISTKVGRLIRPDRAGVHERDTEGFDVPGDHRRVWDFTPDGIRASLEESLERLGLDHVDMLFLHDPEGYDLRRGIDVALPALARLREEGTVSRIGVGSMSTDALLAAARSGNADTIMAAGRYTLAEQPMAAEVIPACREHGVDIVVASVFNSGLLASDEPAAGSRHDYAAVAPELLRHVTAIRDVCRRFGVSLPTAALHFAARGPAVVSTVIAGSRPAQIADSIRRLAEPVPEALWAALAAKGLIQA